MRTLEYSNVFVLSGQCAFFRWEEGISLRVPKRGGGGGVEGCPWSPGALKFLLWSPEPDYFTDWSAVTFLAVEPGAQRIKFCTEPGAQHFQV